MNMKIKKTVLGLLFLSLIGCNQNEMFLEEQYKKVLYVLSESDQTFPVIHSLNETKSTGYLTVYVGGTLAIDKDVTVVFEKDTSILKKYNLSNYDLDTSKYAIELDPSRYEISNYSATLKAGSDKPYVLFPISINPEGLSPDSAYMIPLRIKSTSEFEINPEKSNVLYHVYIENKFAKQISRTTLFMRGTEKTEGSTSTPKQISANKILFPLTKQSVRLNAGMLNSSNKMDLDLINKSSLIMEIGEEDLVFNNGAPYKLLNLKPYKDGLIEVTLMENNDDENTVLSIAESNRYITEFGVTRYYLCYKYRTLKKASINGAPSEWNDWIEIKENLKVPTE